MKHDPQLQAALDAIDAAVVGATNDNAPLIAAKCRGLMRGYHTRWKASPYNVLSVEETYVSDLVNVDSGKKSRTFSTAGKLDSLVQDEHGVWIVDHKTTSEEIADPNAPYWRQLAVEGQINHYYLLQWMHGIKPCGAIWDVASKPGISPKKLPKAQQAAVVATGEYCGERLSAESRQAMTTDERETYEMYEARLVLDCMERPDRYFQRRQVPRLDHEMLEYARELWEHGQEILRTRTRAKQHLPPRNSGACMMYGSPCNFLGICSGYDSPTSDKWRSKRAKHPELTEQVKGLDVLTNSRIRCFQTCKRKHYYQYELGIERVEEKDSEAIYFGSLWHIAMESWWLFFKGNSNEQSNSIDAESICTC